MEAISVTLLDLIAELQSLNALKDFALAGGTSLSLRFNHRCSDDIDLFTNQLIGKQGFFEIQEILAAKFKNDLLFCEIINAELGNQFCFLRALIKRKETAVKVELIQNSQQMFSSEYIRELKLLSLRDVALLKLISLSNRKANKDAYDLDFITDTIPLNELIKLLSEKQNTFADEKYRCLFDLDMETNPINDPSVLLLFDNTNYDTTASKPSHSHDRILIVEGSKNWLSAKASWRKKVKAILR